MNNGGNNNIKILMLGGFVICLIVFIVFTIIDWDYSTIPYATGPYGTNVVHPTKPHDIETKIFGWGWIIFGILYKCIPWK